MLLAAPLTSAVPNDVVYAIAAGPIGLEEDSTSTVGFVPGGADVVQNVETTPRITSAFTLVVDQHFSGWGPAAEIASEINQQYLLTTAEIAEPLATVVDPRTIRVVVPENERGNVAAFVADVLDTDVGSALRRLPAQVICSTRTGIILITGDVQVSPAVITHRDLTITTTVPPPLPSAERPMVERSNWAAVETNARATETARLQDLMDAFDQLDVPPRDQIHILQMLHKAGKLHARLIVDEG
jgi:flagellar P-ring protein precursor FlgI